MYEPVIHNAKYTDLQKKRIHTELQLWEPILSKQTADLVKAPTCLSKQILAKTSGVPVEKSFRVIFCLSTSL